MSRRNHGRAPAYQNFYVNDEVGRRYRVTLSSGGLCLFVGRRCLPGGKERTLTPWGKKGKMLAAKARAMKEVVSG